MTGSRRRGRSRVVLGGVTLAAGVLVLIGCNSPRQVTLINRGDGVARAAKVDRAGNEKAVVYMHGPSGGGFSLRNGESFVMGDAEVTLDGSQMLIANAGTGTITTNRTGYPERMLVGPGAVGAYQLGGEPIAIDGIEVDVGR